MLLQEALKALNLTGKQFYKRVERYERAEPSNPPKNLDTR